MSNLPKITYYTTVTDQDGYKLGFAQEDLGEFDWEEDLIIFEKTLSDLGTIPYKLSFGHELVSQLIELKPPLIWNLNSGVRGITREAQVPALCEMLGIPLVGSGSWTAFVIQDKTLATNWLSLHGIPIDIPNSILIENLVEVNKVDLLIFPGSYIIKPNNEDSSRGVDINSIQKDKNGVKNQVKRMLDNWGAVRIEEYIEGFDISANLACKPEYGLFPLAPVKIDSPIGIYTGAMKNIVVNAPQKVRTPLSGYDKNLSEHVETLALRIGEVFHFRHYARIDLRYDPKNRKLYFLECNICPSFEPDDDYVFGAKLSGLTFSELLNNILVTAYADAQKGYHLREVPAKIRHIFGGNDGRKNS